MTVLESLLALTPYPVPEATITAIGNEVGLDLEADMYDAGRIELYRAKARIFLFLAVTPNVSEGGVSISFTSTEKSFFLGQARKFAELAGEEGLIPGPAYGYKGQNI